MQTVSHISYLVQVPSGVYYLRRVIPPALRPFMPEPWRGKSVWKLSLQTNDYAQAKRRADSGVRSRCNADFTADLPPWGGPGRKLVQGRSCLQGSLAGGAGRVSAAGQAVKGV